MTHITTKKIINEAINDNAQIDINYHVNTREEAEGIVQHYANLMKRTYQELTMNDEFNWFEVVTHDNENIEVTVFYD